MILDWLLVSERIFRIVVLGTGVSMGSAAATDSPVATYAFVGLMALFALVTLLAGSYVLGSQIFSGLTGRVQSRHSSGISVSPSPKRLSGSQAVAGHARLAAP